MNLSRIYKTKTTFFIQIEVEKYTQTMCAYSLKIVNTIWKRNRTNLRTTKNVFQYLYF